MAQRLGWSLKIAKAIKTSLKKVNLRKYTQTKRLDNSGDALNYSLPRADFEVYFVKQGVEAGTPGQLQTRLVMNLTKV